MSENFKNISWPEWTTVRLIGRGSFGAVYEIQKDILGDVEKAALKMITIPQNGSDLEELYNDGYDDESITATFQSHLKSIVAEYSLMRKMSGCVNIVNCDDVRYVQHDDKIGWDIFIKMELLTPLAKSLPDQIPEELVVKVGMDMCSALEMCSRYDIVHRDIKPQNIFVSPDGVYKLGDFGIAKTVEKTMGGTKIGTYKYMAPEVYHNHPYGSGADIYSLGLVLYWLLNERRMPFLPLPPAKLTAGAEEKARQRRLIGEMLPPPAHGSEALKKIVLKACAYAPKERYRSAAEMMKDLKALAAPAEAALEKAAAPVAQPLPTAQPAPVPAVQIPKPQEVYAPKVDICIRFLDSNGALLAERRYHPGENVEPPRMAQSIDRDGLRYYFKGWVPNIPETAAASADFFAVYQDPVAVIRFLNTDGSVIQSREYSVKERVEAPKMVQEFESSGVRYLFQGWEPSAPNIAEKSVDCYAVYKEDLYAGHKGNRPKKKHNKRNWIVSALMIVVALLIGAYNIPYGWEIVDGKQYFNKWGNKVVGQVAINGNGYIFDDSGAMCVGWINFKGNQYYLGTDGKIRTGWQTLHGHKYYFGDNGSMRIGLHEIDGNKYFFGANGAMHSGWLTMGYNTYYFGDDGKMYCGLYRIDEKLYYFSSDGRRLSGFRQIDNDTYYFGEEGGVLCAGWMEIDDHKYYFDETGRMLKGEGMQDANGKWYYFDEWGRLIGS